MNLTRVLVIPGLWIYRDDEGDFNITLLARWNWSTRRRRPHRAVTALVLDVPGLTIFRAGRYWSVWLGNRHFMVPRKVYWTARGR